VQFLGVISEEQLEAELDAAAAELAPEEPEAEPEAADAEGEGAPAGEGDEVPATEA